MTKKYDSMVRAWNGKRRRKQKRGSNPTFTPPVPIESLLQTASSQSTKTNTKKAKTLLLIFADANNANDSYEVSTKSSDLVINLIFQHCNCPDEQMLGYESVLALCQRLKNVYLDSGHRSAWNPLSKDGVFGNPLINNEDLNRFR